MSGAPARRVLVVEDEALIAAMIVEWLEEIGCKVIGPAFRVSDGFELAETEHPDAAVLDVNVNSERIFPLAEYLRSRGVSLVFATGYGERIAEVAHKETVLEKPFTFDQLANAMAGAFGKAGGA